LYAREWRTDRRLSGKDAGKRKEPNKCEKSLPAPPETWTAKC